MIVTAQRSFRSVAPAVDARSRMTIVRSESEFFSHAAEFRAHYEDGANQTSRRRRMIAI
jgi:hypothetical protein